MGANNASFDFAPNGGALTTREVVNTSNCNDGCHKTLALHGGGRLDVKLCVTCHNPTNGDPESGNTLDLKVMAHKIHNGKYLPSVNLDFAGEYNGQYKTTPDAAVKGTHYRIWGYNNTEFDFSEVLIPSNPANCVMCHKNAADADNYKTKPTKEACGSCHDGINFATGAGNRMWFPDSKITMGVGRTNVAGFAAEIAAGHKGGAQSGNQACTFCHSASGSQASADASPAPVPAVHGDFTSGWSKMATDYTITMTMSAPANTTHYVAGEKPKLTIVFKDAVTGTAIDHTTIADNAGDFGPGTAVGNLYGLCTTTGSQIGAAATAACTGKGVTVNGALNLYVSGPRALKKPALATAAINKTFFQANGNIYGNAANDLRKRSGTNAARQDDFQLVNGVADLTKLTGVLSRVDAAKLEYQLSDVTGLTSGTYIAFIQAAKKSAAGVLPKAMSLGLTTFKVGQATEEKRVAYGCPECHSTTVWHDNASNGINGNHPARFDTDYCGSCHDNEAQITSIATGSGTGAFKVSHDSEGNQVFTPYTFPAGSGQAWYIGGNKFGYSTTPIGRRVHGVHSGGIVRKDGSPMINYPFEIYSGHNVSITFPQDVKNCEKCHNSETSGTWKTLNGKIPNRLVCLACHDSDAAYAHATTMTVDPTTAICTAALTAGSTADCGGAATPNKGPFNGDEVEACQVCHASP